MEQIEEAILMCGKAFVDGLGRAFEAIKPTIERFMEIYWDEYRQAGMPYGESDDGMMQWIMTEDKRVGNE